MTTELELKNNEVLTSGVKHRIHIAAKRRRDRQYPRDLCGAGRVCVCVCYFKEGT